MNEQKPITLEGAEAELTNAVYTATRLIEDLERKGHYQSNGHHARQDIARYAVERLKKAWVSHPAKAPEPDTAA